MCLLCHGAVQHGEKSFNVGDRVRFRDSAPNNLWSHYPGTLVVHRVTDNPPDQVEKQGLQSLTLVDENGRRVEIKGVFHFSSDLFALVF